MAKVYNFPGDYDGTLFGDAQGRAYNKENPPPWAVVQFEVGIRRIMDRWQSERWIDQRTGDVRYGNGELWKHYAMPQEAEALRRIDQQSVAYHRAQGRTYITEEEAFVLAKEREYMQNCQKLAFRGQYPRYAAHAFNLRPEDGDFKFNTINEKLCHAWIELKTFIPRHVVKDLLANVSAVYELRASLDMDVEAPVRRKSENTYQQNSAAS